MRLRASNADIDEPGISQHQDVFVQKIDVGQQDRRLRCHKLTVPVVVYLDLSLGGLLKRVKIKAPKVNLEFSTIRCGLPPVALERRGKVGFMAWQPPLPPLFTEVGLAEVGDESPSRLQMAAYSPHPFQVLFPVSPQAKGSTVDDALVPAGQVQLVHGLGVEI